MDVGLNYNFEFFFEMIHESLQKYFSKKIITIEIKNYYNWNNFGKI